MIGGIALLGTVTATLACWLVETVAAEKGQAEDLQVAIRRLEDKMDRLATQETREVNHDHSHAFPSSSLSRSYGSEPVTCTGPAYLGPLPVPPRQS